jgi:DNA-binding NarL/FixJ family response regulator
MSVLSSEKPARVCVVSNHRLAADYLVAILQREAKWKLVELNNHSSFSPSLPISVFVIDAASLPVPLCECVAKLRSRDSQARMVVVDQENTDGDRLFGLRIQGVVAYGEVPRNLLSAVRAVIQGKTWLRPELLESYLNRNLTVHNGGFSNRSALTSRELEVMEFIKKRLSNAEIARHLGIRDSTVKFHVSNLFSKLNVRSRRELLNREDAVRLWSNLLLYSSSLPHADK